MISLPLREDLPSVAHSLGFLDLPFRISLNGASYNELSEIHYFEIASCKRDTASLL